MHKDVTLKNLVHAFNIQKASLVADRKFTFLVLDKFYSYKFDKQSRLGAYFTKNKIHQIRVHLFLSKFFQNIGILIMCSLAILRNDSCPSVSVF